MNRTVTNVYFSPSGTTAKVANQIAANFSDSASPIDLLKSKGMEEKSFTPEDILTVAMPVFAGRIPTVCVDMLNNLKGDNTPAVAVVVYGNRAYEDALLELTDILKGNGFIIAGASAVVARHSIFPDVAAGRPDNSDIEKLNEFARRCSEALESGKVDTVSVPGNKPYREAGALPLSVSVGKACNECGKCIKICPVDAIPAGNPHTTDNGKCIRCTACIYVCPQKARMFKGFKYSIGAKAFAKKCASRLEPEFFVSET